MIWNKGEKRDVANLAKSLALGARIAVKLAKGHELSEDDERKIWEQIKENGS